MKRKIFIFIVIVSLGLMQIPHASADHAVEHRDQSSIRDTFDIKKYLPKGGIAPTATSTPPTEGEKSILQFIANTIDFLIAIIGSFSLLVFIIGALYLLVSEGQEDRLQKGKQAMVYALIGLAIALMAYVITTAVQSIFF